MARSASVGHLLCQRSPGRPTRGCHNTPTTKNPTSSSCPEPKTLCLPWSWQRANGCVTPRPCARLTANNTSFTNIARGSKVCSPELNVGSVPPIRKIRSGAQSRRTTLPPGSAKTSEGPTPARTDASRVFSWLICESSDDKGNVVSYQYKPEDSVDVDLTQAHERNRSNLTRSSKRYLKHVFYGNRIPYFPDLTQPTAVALPTDWCFQAAFDYGEHDLKNPLPVDAGHWNCRFDPFSTYRSTFEVRTYRLCRRVLMFHHFEKETDVGLNCLVRSTDFVHSQTPTDPTKAAYSYLLTATQTGYRRDGQGGYLSNSLPPVEFQYTDAAIDETVRDVDPESLENLPYGLDDSHYRWVDLDGEGLPGILTEQAGSWFYKANHPGRR